LSKANSIKTTLLDHLRKTVDEKITTMQSIIDSVIESKNNETKSTAGDKYETGRAMMQAEQEKNEIRLAEAKKLRAILSTIDFKTTHTQIALGSLVITDKEKYFISIGVGKITLENETYYALSPNAPVGKLLLTKKIYDRFSFQGIERTILEIR